MEPNNVLGWLLLLQVGLSGCFMATTRGAMAPSRPIEERRVTGVSFLWGLTGTTAVATDCSHGLALTRTYWPWWGVIVSGLTVGIVTPITFSYVCASPASASRQ